MILALDIGNTNITIGVYDGRELKFVSRMATDRARMEDQYAIELRDILDIYGVAIADIEGSIISSVVPPLTKAIRRAIRRLTGVEPLNIGPGIKTGLNIRINNPATLGADFVAACVAVIEHYSCPAIIFDLGTATTIAVLDKSASMLGGCILPGVGISLDALTSRTAQLPSISLDAPSRVIGANTVDCMRSGLVYGTASMMDGMCDRIEEELGMPCTVIATGGLARDIIPHCKREIIFSDYLLLEGLRLLYERNTSAQEAPQTGQ